MLILINNRLAFCKNNISYYYTREAAPSPRLYLIIFFNFGIKNH